MRWLLHVASLCALLAGCTERPVLQAGEGCELSSQCMSPLVCRLERCREECRQGRDCPPGQSCVLDEGGFGGCQLVDETECVMDSQCPEPTICVNRQCTNECTSAVDCAGGGSCINDPDRGNICRYMTGQPCDRTSECPQPLICGLDGTCRAQCREQRDCRPEERCEPGAGGAGICVPGPDAGPPTDAGATDGAMMGMVDAGDGGA